jgi:DNA polymerase-3 subunit delta'
VLAPTPPKDNPRGAPALRIEQIRELEHRAALAPFEGPRKVFILDDAERMTLPTAQALLKTLEEPPPRTLLILILTSVRILPPTVLSRCQRVRFRPLGPEAVAGLLAARGVDPVDGPLLARHCQGQAGLALATPLDQLRQHRAAALALAALPLPQATLRLDDARPDRQSAAAYLETYWVWYRDALCLAAGADPALLVNADREADLRALAAGLGPERLAMLLGAVKDAWRALESNVNPRLALEQALAAVAGRAA